MPLAPKIRYTIYDNDRDKSTTEVHVQAGPTIAQFAAFAQAYAEAMDPVIGGVIRPTASMSVPVDISTLTGNALDDTSDVEEVASFQFRCADGDGVDVNIGGLATGDLVAGSDALNTADTQIAALITLIEDGNGVIAPSSIAESDIIALLYARRETRPSGRRRI